MTDSLCEIGLRIATLHGGDGALDAASWPHGLSPQARSLASGRSPTAGEAAAIHRRRHWDACRCDDLPPALALVVCDTAVHHGPEVTVELLRSALNLRVAGAIDDQVLVLIRERATDPELVIGLIAERLAAMARSEYWPAAAARVTAHCSRLLVAALATSASMMAPVELGTVAGQVREFVGTILREDG